MFAASLTEFPCSPPPRSLSSMRGGAMRIVVSSTREAQQPPLVRHRPVASSPGPDDVAQHVLGSCTAAPRTRRTIRYRPADARSSARTPDASPAITCSERSIDSAEKDRLERTGRPARVDHLDRVQARAVRRERGSERGGHREQPAAVADGAVGGAGLGGGGHEGSRWFQWFLKRFIGRSGLPLEGRSRRSFIYGSARVAR